MPLFDMTLDDWVTNYLVKYPLEIIDECFVMITEKIAGIL
jgi:hypothetical protein